MSADSGSDMAANAWPGFVDILSAVVIMFVFFVLIISAVLYFHTITYTAKVEGKVIESNETVDMTGTMSSESIAELKQENEELREQVQLAAAMYDSSDGASESESTSNADAPQTFGMQASEQAVITSDGGQDLVLFHDPGAITVDAASEVRIEEFVKNALDKFGSENIELTITSPKNADASTQTREKRLAVARMLNVRNALLNSNLDRQNITLTVVETEAVEGSDDWTRMSINVIK
ncbi:MAG: hypothetical protein AB8B97_24435 [Granulosicoccus sp.]